jgi:hypothetical protein
MRLAVISPSLLIDDSLAAALPMVPLWMSGCPLTGLATVPVEIRLGM